MKNTIKLTRMSTTGNHRRNSDSCKEVEWTIIYNENETIYNTEDGKVYIRRK